jgi:hypothetical protein
VHTFAVGVLAAEMIYASWISFLTAGEVLNCLPTWARRCAGVEARDMANLTADMVTTDVVYNRNTNKVEF